MKKLLSVCLIIALLFCGCSLKKAKTAEEMPADKPWNRLVMETDNGYYYGVEACMLSLRYCEKSNGADIFLCAKPECSHSGEETCTATYNFLSITNYILYDGSIYFTANTPADGTLGVSLYKASLDGTTLDKVGDIRRVKYDGDNGYIYAGNEFIIHKGYAYIPYNIGEGIGGYSGFIEDGFAKMDIQTGKVELIYSNTSFADSMSTYVKAGAGDYVYYHNYCSNGDKSRNGDNRYNIKSGKTEKISGTLGDLLGTDPKIESYHLEGYTEKTLYVRHKKGKTLEIIGYDAETFEPNGLKIDFSDNKDLNSRFRFFDDKIFCFDYDEIKVYNGNGEFSGSHGWKTYLKENLSLEYSNDVRDIDICDGKVYIGYYDNMTYYGMEYDSQGNGISRKRADYSMYCCTVDDVIAGRGDWKKVYTIKDTLDYWKEEPISKLGAAHVEY